MKKGYPTIALRCMIPYSSCSPAMLNVQYSTVPVESIATTTVLLVKNFLVSFILFNEKGISLPLSNARKNGSSLQDVLEGHCVAFEIFFKLNVQS